MNDQVHIGQTEKTITMKDWGIFSRDERTDWQKNKSNICTK